MKDAIEFKIHKIKTLEFFIIEPSKNIIKNFNSENLQLDFGVGFSFNTDLNLFAVIIGIHQTYIDEKEEIELLRFRNVTEYFIKDLKDVLVDTQNIKFSEEGLIEILLSVAYSTIRGIIFEKTSGSFMNEFYLPIINPSEVIRQMQENQDIKSKESKPKKKISIAKEVKPKSKKKK
jgi:hypothetical protein